MSFFRSAAARRIMYFIVAALALVRLANRLHSEPFYPEAPASPALHATMMENGNPGVTPHP